jgi:hypothetical protein
MASAVKSPRIWAPQADLSAVNMRRDALFSAVLLCVALAVSASAGESAQQVFPLSPGTFWIYHGLVRSWLEGSSVGKVTDVTWKMSVVRAVKRDGITAAIVSGFPGDLDWSEGHAEPQTSILVVTQDAKFYLKSGFDSQSLLPQIDSPKYPLQELIDADDWILQLPLAAGMRFGCDEGAAQREDGLYCWVVGPPHPVALGGVKGVASGTHIAFEVRYSTNPDDTEIEFAPGIGITSYQYHHHGTTAETELHLVEFHSGDSGR